MKYIVLAQVVAHADPDPEQAAYRRKSENNPGEQSFHRVSPSIWREASLANSPFFSMRSSNLPDSTTCPSCMTQMRSASRMVERRWATTMRVADKCLRLLMTFAWLVLSRLDVASSSRNTDGFLDRARAIMIRCFCPPEKVEPPWGTKVCMPMGMLRMSSSTAASLAASQAESSSASLVAPMMLKKMLPWISSPLWMTEPIWRLDPIKVRRQIGSVIQSGELIQGNIFFNIMGATNDADEDSAWEAAKLAAVDEDIRNMPMGMHTFVPHGGSTFSGGQKQRIMIARALSKKPSVFLLDEATSNLDNTSQAKVMSNLRHLSATRIVVAHRLSTIRDADRIYVMHDGQVVESGKFEDLMEKKGLFARLASRQMEGLTR
eukprot:TRINITY_DN2543_c0_g1_i1.p1 TRINITY_DN2543_c0_g1~~TRINITY_DN2543_c0_g1_i1.p1  ORF type:complete len:376 (+),score=124.52 TRINITY_DN2543_c0_g1_i1:438-1565(+)